MQHFYITDFPNFFLRALNKQLPDPFHTKTKVIKQRERVSVCLYPGYKGNCKLQNKAVSNNSDLFRKVCPHEFHMTPQACSSFCLSLSFTTQNGLEHYLVISRTQNCCTVIQLAVTFFPRCIALSLSVYLFSPSPAHRLPVCSGLNGMQMEWVFRRPFIRP